MIKEFLKKLWDNFGSCEFKKQCKYFDKKSEVCLCGGGSYCGQYSELTKVKQLKIKETKLQ